MPASPRDTRKRAPYGKKKGTCRGCGKVVWKGSSSLAEPMCHPCRRVDPQRSLTRATRRERKVSPRGSTTARGYGTDHIYARRAARAAFQPGDPCARCAEPMLVDDPLDLDHTDDRSGYLGLSHAWCNRSHKPEGTPRPAIWPPRRSCVICGAEFRPKRDEQRACCRACGVELRSMNRAVAA